MTYKGSFQCELVKSLAFLYYFSALLEVPKIIVAKFVNRADASPKRSLTLTVKQLGSTARKVI